VPDETIDPRLAYRLLTGPDDDAFCRRVSQALAEGYRLYGSPALTFNGERVIAAQALVLDEPVAPRMQNVVDQL
jgi:hypothetical protein